MEEENVDVNEEVVTPQEEVVEETHEEAKTVPYERFSKEVAKRKHLEEQLAVLQPKDRPVLPKQDDSNQFDSLVDNLSVLKNLDEDEINELRTEAKGLGVDPIKFARSKAFKAHLETFRVNKQAEAKTPAPSHRTAVFEGKTFAEVVTGESSPEAKKAAFIAQRDALLNRGRNQMI